jgi:hypothetical protein
MREPRNASSIEYKMLEFIVLFIIIVFLLNKIFKHYDCNFSRRYFSTEKVERLNLINSCTGYKSANLIATKSVDGAVNVAIFSSITHLGSNPVDCTYRPTTVPTQNKSNRVFYSQSY